MSHLKLNATIYYFIHSFWLSCLFIAIIILANSHESTTECMRKLLNSSEVQAILSEAISDGGEEVVACYLHDFAHMTYIPQGDDELKVTVEYHYEMYSLKSYVVNFHTQMRRESEPCFSHMKKDTSNQNRVRCVFTCGRNYTSNQKPQCCL